MRWCGLIVLLLGSVACSPRPTDQGSEQRLNIAVSVEIASLDPQTTASVDAIKLQSALFETLVRVDAETGDMVPAGAIAWEVSADGCCYRFDLDPTLRWSDGNALVASDYVFALRRLLDPRLGAPFADLYFGIVGARALHSGHDPNGEALGVRAVHEHRLEICIERPIPYFLSLLARPCAAALPQHYLIRRGAQHSRTTGWSQQPGFPVSGPYQLAHWGVNEQILLRKNPTHALFDDLKFESLHFFAIESAYAQEHGFQSGALDVISKIASERIATYRGSAALVSELEMGTFYVITQTESPALQDRALRQALSRSVDRNAIVQRLRQREEQPATGFVPPLWQSYQPQFDPESLEETHFPSVLAGEPIHLRLLISSSEGNLLIAEALQAMWMETLPVKIEIVRQEWKSYLDSRNRGQFDLCLATWIGDYFDPLTFLELWQSQAVNNFCRWKHPDYDAWLAAASQESEPLLRFGLLAQAEELLIAEAPILPLFYLSRVYLKSEKLERWPQTLLNTVDYRALR